MMEVHVQDAEFHRLLGYPRGKQPEGRAAELAEWARSWYAEHGRPWIYSREAGSLALADGAAHIDGVPFTSPRLTDTLDRAGAHGAFLVAVSAGPELEEEAQRHWRAERPDEYFFLEIYGSAVVEHLTTIAGARLCAWADPQGLAVLPHYSPGYPEWDVLEQPRLLQLMAAELPHPLDVLESGMLRPKKSLLAVFGVTRHTDRLQPLTQLIPCENCSYTPCQFRRVQYRVNRKALARWAAERLQLTPRDDGTIDAVFRYEGVTCTNLGYPLRFDYTVKLGRRDEGYPIREQHCAPVDEGYQRMCTYQEFPAELMQSIATEKPLLGQPLHAALAWPRPECAAGCYCEPDARAHKWGLVFETIYYKLNHV